ncbi:Hypothetical predicted protein [Mytilus galloprovincialis]|uniref:C-type lectin domain-containing protein n=1 Tax=Mytilus galloprovincialis TaxID=29158 RepID=A0A8B6GSI9_MYTGA|nr:Hypothetical predicted protein [Mytilus galloprovincialis]
MASLRFNLIFLILIPAGLTANCPNGWLIYDSSCYLISQTSVDWADSVTFCKAFGSKLVEIESQKEDNFIQTTLKHKHEHDSAPPHGYWIGLTDVVIQNEWTWIDSGRELSNMYSHWEKGQPDSRQSENCGILWHSTGFTWHDDFCSDKVAFFICEKELRPGGAEIIG